MIYVLLFVIFILLVRIDKIINYYRNNKLGWKTSKLNYKKIIYAEKIDGNWEQIEIEADFNIGTFEPHFKDSNEWKDYPEWAQDRIKIINRVKEKFPLKDNISEIGTKNN